MTTKVFFDMEFTGLHKNTTLISIGLVSECGKKYYAEFNDYDLNQIDSWLQENVISNLEFNGLSHASKEVRGIRFIKDDLVGVKNDLTNWLSQFERVEMWSDCLAYDWVLFNDMFGDAFSIPENVFYIPFDICTLFYVKGLDPDMNREEYVDEDIKNKHNALHDAEIIKKCYDKARLMNDYQIR